MTLYKSLANFRNRKYLGIVAAVSLLLTPAAVYALQNDSLDASSHSTDNTSSSSQSSQSKEVKGSNSTTRGSSSQSSSSQSSELHVHSDTSNKSSYRVSVDGQDIPVPENGTVHRTIKNQDGGNTDVNVEHSSTQSSSDGTTSVTSSLHMSSESTSIKEDPPQNDN